ncbi:MAG TPA: PQQ-binding-like beta-propeller repeat protein, partial [Ktedonobacteraceae bacterium]
GPQGQAAKPGATASPTQVLKPEGPDSGLYIAHLGNASASNESALYKIDYQTGKVLWKYQFKLSHPDNTWGSYAPPNDLIVQQGMVFVTSFDASYVYSAYAITASTGQLAWSHPFDSSVELVRGQISMPVLSQGIYYITGVIDKNPDGDLLYALDARTGKLLQTYHSVRGFTIQNNVLYTSDLDSGPIKATDLNNGQVLWEKRIGTNGQPLLAPSVAGEFFEAPFVLQNRVYLRANDQNADEYKSSLYAFDTTSGQLIFHSPVMTTESPVTDVPFSDTMIVSGVIGDSLFALNPANDNLLWSKKAGFAGNLAISGKDIYATFDPHPFSPLNAPDASGIMSLDGATGSLIWQKIIASGGPSISGLLVYQSILYINQGTVTQGYRTTAMDMSGKVLWKISLGGYTSEVLVP